MTDKLSSLSWLQDLYELSQTASAATDLEEALCTMLRHIAEGFAAGSGTVALVTPEQDALEIASGTHLPKEAIGQRVPLGHGVLGRVAQSAQPVLINGTLDSSQTSRPNGVNARRTPTSAMCWPLELKGRTIGVLAVNRYDEAQGLYEDRDLQRGSIMDNMVALVVENLRMHREQQQRILHLSELNQRMSEMNRQLAEAQAQLLQNEKMASIGQLAAGVAHEINNPVAFVSSNLRSLSGYVKQLIERVSAGQPAQPMDEDLQYMIDDVPVLLGETQDGLERVRKIVQDLRDFSRIDASEKWELADLNAALRSTVNIGLTDFKHKVTVVCEYGELPPVQCLLSQVNQVFLNLLVNAAQAIDVKGIIQVRTGSTAEHAWVEVEDSGCGIPQENLTRIFDPFFTTKPVGTGTGLGLSLSYSIVRKHEGSLEVRSQVGVGTCFRLTLPLKHAES